jgi:hypothetical protein
MLTFVNLGSGFTEIGAYFCKLDFCNINFSYLPPFPTILLFN